MAAATGLAGARLVRPFDVLLWVFSGFLGVVACGFLLHAFWLSGVLSAALMVLWLPPIWRWLGWTFDFATFTVIVTSAGLVGGLAFLVVVSEYEKTQRRTEYLDLRATVLATAQQSLAQGKGERLQALVNRYEFVSTPGLDRLEAALAERRAKERQTQDVEKEESKTKQQIDEIVEDAMEQRQKGAK